MDEKWISFLKNILKIPGAKVNRVAFLKKEFGNLSLEEMQVCVNESPVKVVPLETIDQHAKALINSHTFKVSTLSAISGIPGGFAMIAAIPADLANYYYHVVCIGQKLGYLYGYPDMIDDNNRLTPEGEILLTAFIGVMNKVEVANQLIKRLAVEISERVGSEVATRVVANIFSKQLLSQGIETVARKLGTQIASKGASRGLSKAIPVISGVICGGLTYATYRSQAKRLQEALKQNAIK